MVRTHAGRTGRCVQAPRASVRRPNSGPIALVVLKVQTDASGNVGIEAEGYVIRNELRYTSVKPL